MLIEGVMTLSGQPWLSGLALGYLCLINAIATGVTLARGDSVIAEPATAPEVTASPKVAKSKVKLPTKARALRVVAGGATEKTELAP